jgi:predicted exporter
VLGGAVLFSDGRLLGLFSSLPIRDVVDGAHRVFVWALAVVVGTGVFMVCGVAVKVYYLPVFWYKMLTLAVGVLFALFIRKPLVDREISEVNPKIVKLVAVASIMVWFTVAATGRWIGFS